jgi:hypothetical protein
MRALALAAVLLVGAVGSATADEWFILGQKTLNSTDASAEVDAEKGNWFKEDIKKTKISVEGGDVEISKVVLRWNNRPDDVVSNVGVVKSGGETAPKDAPGREATLTGAAVQYKILNNAPSATLKLWGYD